MILNQSLKTGNLAIIIKIQIKYMLVTFCMIYTYRLTILYVRSFLTTVDVYLPYKCFYRQLPALINNYETRVTLFDYTKSNKAAYRLNCVVQQRVVDPHSPSSEWVQSDRFEVIVCWSWRDSVWGWRRRWWQQARALRHVHVSYTPLKRQNHQIVPSWSRCMNIGKQIKTNLTFIVFEYTLEPILPSLRGFSYHRSTAVIGIMEGNVSA